MLIDCDTCAVRDLRCGDCVMTVLLDAPGTSAHVREVDVAEQAALAALADSGLVPRLQLVPLGLPRLRDGAGPSDGTQHAV